MSYPNFMPASLMYTQTSPTGSSPDEVNAGLLRQIVDALQTSANPAVKYPDKGAGALIYQPPALADTKANTMFGRFTSKGALQDAFNHMQNLREQEAEVLLERARRARMGR